MAEMLSNRASTLIPLGLNSSQTSFTVSGNTGFPTTAQFRLRIDNELLLVTSGGNSTLLWVVTRGIEGTVAAAHGVNCRATAVLTAAGLAQYIAEQIAAIP